MNIILIGAGPIGVSLIELALHDGHEVTVVEQDEKRAAELAKNYDIRVLRADVSAPDIMQEAGADKADAVVAATSDDATNLMAMFLGLEGKVKTLVSVVNVNGHQNMFERLGVHILLDPEVVIARHLYGIVSQPRVEDLVTLEEGGQVFQVRLNEQSPLAGKKLDEAAQEELLPKALAVVAIKREEERLIPTGETHLEPGDHLTVFSQDPVSESQIKIFTGEKPSA